MRVKKVRKWNWSRKRRKRRWQVTKPFLDLLLDRQKDFRERMQVWGQTDGQIHLCVHTHVDAQTHRHTHLDRLLYLTSHTVFLCCSLRCLPSTSMMEIFPNLASKLRNEINLIYSSFLFKEILSSYFFLSFFFFLFLLSFYEFPFIFGFK